MSIIHEPLHPGEIVRDILLSDDSPFNDITDAADKLGIHRVTLSRLLNGHANISLEMACKLALVLGTSIDMWLGIQCDYDIAQAQKLLKKIKLKKAANSIYNKRKKSH